jgi:hypothetical protein
MKLIGASLIVLAVTTFVADARIIHKRRFRELDAKADIIVVATPVSSKDTAEQIDFPQISRTRPVIGLSSEFEVNFVLKGDNNLKKLVVHHYRLPTPEPVISAPNLASFDPKESTRYLLFLQREPDGRYAPFDQVDPSETAMLKLDQPGWDKMKLDDFKKWLDAAKWLDVVNPAKRQPIFPGGGLLAEIPPGGTGEGNLHEAALNGKLEKAKELIKAHPELVFNQSSYGSQTPLHLAVEYGHKEVAELLLANNANIEAKAYGGMTPLLSAVFGGHKDLVELLLAHKADVNLNDDVRRTPLHMAAENGYTDIAALLLAHKADVNAKNRDGRTPLRIAVLLKHEDLAELLRQHGGLE